MDIPFVFHDLDELNPPARDVLKRVMQMEAVVASAFADQNVALRTGRLVQALARVLFAQSLVDQARRKEAPQGRPNEEGKTDRQTDCGCGTEQRVLLSAVLG